MDATEHVLWVVARQGFVWRSDLASDERRAAERLVREGRLRQDRPDDDGRYVRYYDPDWQPLPPTPLRLVAPAPENE